MALTRRTDIAARALGRLPGVFKNTSDDPSYVAKPNYEALVRIFLEELQEAYGAFFDILEGFAIDSAIGSQLDVLGVILDERREGLSDSDYRQILKLKIYIISSDGTIASVIAATEDLTGGTLVRFTEPSYAAVAITTNGLLASQSILDKIHEVVGAGIDAIVTTVTGNPFALSDEPSSTPAAGSGLDRFAYTSLDSTGEGFADFDSTHSPNGNITNVVTVNTVSNTQVYSFDIAAKDRTTQIIGTYYTITYTSDGTATATEIIDGLVADFNANVNVNTLFKATNIANVMSIRELSTELMTIKNVSAKLTKVYAGELSDRHAF
jgi:hypothetical protein